MSWILTLVNARLVLEIKRSSIVKVLKKFFLLLGSRFSENVISKNKISLAKKELKLEEYLWQERFYPWL